LVSTFTLLFGSASFPAGYQKVEIHEACPASIPDNTAILTRYWSYP